MIKFKHTVFALPFALMGAFLAARGVPGPWVLFWVVVAMAGARTAAMGFNRIVDRKFDAMNPRTRDRALPAGQISVPWSWIMVIVAAALFFFACWQLNPLTMAISPVALGICLGYSLTKRFTWACHIVLGIALAFSPLGGWVAVSGTLAHYPWVLSLAVLCWVAGFDTVYACMDADFDRCSGLFSLPARFGPKTALRLAMALHGMAFVLFALTGVAAGLGIMYHTGLVLAGAAMVFQHRLIAPDDLSRIKMSFFTMNGVISLALFVATWLDLSL